MFLSRHLPSDQNRRDDSGRVEIIEEALDRKVIAFLQSFLRKQLLDLDLPGHITGPVSGLPEVQMLFAADEFTVRQPTPWGPFPGERHRLLHLKFVPVKHQPGGSPGRPLSEHDPHEFAGSRRVVVEEAEVHEHLFDPRGQASDRWS